MQRSTRTISAAALAATLTIAGCAAPQDDEVEATEESAVDPAEDPDPEPEDPAEDPEPEPAPEAEAGTEDHPLPIGDTATVGDWTVTVTDVDLDAEDRILDANQFNDPVTDGHTRAVIAIDATYNGDDAATAWIDLGVTVLGADARSYTRSTDTDNRAVVYDSLTDEPEVRQGGQVAGNVMIPVPDDALDGALIEIDQRLSFGDDTAVYYAIS